MTGLDAIMGSARWYALCLASVALVIGQLTVLIRAIREGRDRRALLPAALNLLLGFGVFAVLMDCAYSGFVSAADAVFLRPFEWALFKRPWLLYAALELFSAALLIPGVRDSRRYRATHLTPEAIRQAVDLLPEGIAFSSPDGTVLLSNLRINELCRALTGSALSGDMFVAREEAAARAALHNQLGQVLLMGRHCLEHPDATDPEMVCLATGQMNAFLLGEAEAPVREKEDALQSALIMCGVIGVTAEYRGARPRGAAARSLLALAIRECAANTVKHARGDRIYVDAADSGTLFRVSVFNNGEPPEGPVAESGGLLALRRRAEAEGGSMRVQSRPVFSLTLELPDRIEAEGRE